VTTGRIERTLREELEDELLELERLVVRVERVKPLGSAGKPPGPVG
jgi:hypothetical protein